jgi:hypothetical protein
MEFVFTPEFFEWGNNQSTRLMTGEKEWNGDKPREREKDEPFDDSGWGFPWPKIPNNGEPEGPFWEDNDGGDPKNCACENDNVMGYYIPKHFIYETAHRKGLDPNDFKNIEKVNNKRIECKKWGIHICLNNIQKYVDYQLIPLVDSKITNLKERQYFRDYAVYLLVMNVVAHEWAHYRTEVLAFQQYEGLSAILDPYDLIEFGGNYLTYFRATAGSANNFEEVFAEWNSLRFGIFNSRLVRPDNMSGIAITDQQRLQRDWLIRYGILHSMERGSRPYGDIVNWVDFDGLKSNESMADYVNEGFTLSRTVSKYSSVRSPKMIDIMLHNINCYSKKNYKTKQHKLALSTSVGSKSYSASIRPGLGFDVYDQSPAFDKMTYAKKNKARGVLYIEKGIRIPSFKKDIHRLPFKNYKIMPVTVYVH